MKLNPKDALAIIKDPEQAAEYANLYYVTEEQMPITRHRKGRGFYFKHKSQKITDPLEIDRIKKLIIPPAWKNVKITNLTNGHLQAVGRDEKNRKQYLYHNKWSEIRNKTKFYKMSAFGAALPKIRKQIEIDLKEKEMTKRKCLALVINLMEETHIRIGNKYYAKKNKTYGLSTMRTKHIEILEDKVKFNFIGKKGKPNEVKVKSKKLRKLILQCEEIPGWELFKYYDENGNHHTIDSGMLNDYIQEVSGELFSAKDFRTWAGSKIFFETLAECGIAKTTKETDKNLIKAYDAAAKGLNNTRAVCKSSYIHPIITESYTNKSIRPYIETIGNSKASTLLSVTEESMLKLLNTYTINIKS